MFKIDLTDPESIAEARDKMRSASAALKMMVGPFWNKGLSAKRKTELAHVGKFIQIIGGQIQQMGESPDFLIKIDNNVIGLEIRQLFTRQVEYNRHIQNLLTHAADFHKGVFMDDRFLVNFWLENGFNYKKHERAQYVSQISDYVRAFTSGGDIAIPGFIDHIDVLAHSQLSFVFNEGAYCPEPLNHEILLEAIAEKEDKLASYIANSGTPNQWLLLVSQEVGSESFDSEDFAGVESLETAFDSIYLLRDFDSKVVKLY